jgi:hypothetical protein
MSVISCPMLPKFRKRTDFWKVARLHISSGWWQKLEAENDYGASVELYWEKDKELLK